MNEEFDGSPKLTDVTNSRWDPELNKLVGPSELVSFNLSVPWETVELIDKLQAHLGLPDRGAVFMRGLSTLDILTQTNAQVIMDSSKAKDMGLII